jgi:LuxR family maltose regulon positive regulatory protein
MDPSQPLLLQTKLWPPAARAGLVRRARLDSLLQAGLRGKLCLIEAPAGFGKTTLLSQFHAGGDSGGVAWVSLDRGDNDPVRFWSYVIGAFRTVQPSIGGSALEIMRRSTANLDQVVVPMLLNELAVAGAELTLVLDDYHVVTSTACHEVLAFFLDYLPANVHVALSTRADPPLPLARMRVQGDLTELREAELRFTVDETTALLNAAVTPGLTHQDVELLVERTEGWVAALHLAGLSLRGRTDASAFIASFHGDHRHVADFLATEVLAHQPERIRTFLVRTSILERLSGPLCDAMLEAHGSAELLRELERANLFLVPLDERREWYRYHQLFAELLRLELAISEGGRVLALHQRAAAWHRQARNAEEAVHHATAAGDVAGASALIAEHWLAYARRGLLGTVARWIEALPDEAIAANPPAALIAATAAGLSGASLDDTERLLAAAEAGTWDGPLPDGMLTLAFAVAHARALVLFDDVGRSLRAGRRALELAGPEPSPSRWMALGVVARATYLSGQPVAAAPLEDLVRRVTASEHPYAVVAALALLSLVAGDNGDEHTAATLARQAAEVAEEQGVDHVPLCGIAHLALGRALAAHGKLVEAEEQLGLLLQPEIDGLLVERAHALLALASVRHARGDTAAARGLLARARRMVEGFTDPGMLPALLDEAERAFGSAPRRRVGADAPLTERELAVLRLLPTRLSLREIGRELYVSINTVRTHAHAVYRKLGSASRADAVDRARELGLLPGPAPLDLPGEDLTRMNRTDG